MVSLVDAMQDGRIEATPCLVMSNIPTAGGLQKATDRGIATAVVDHKPYAGDRVAFEDALHAKLLAANTDVICLAGFMRVLTASFIDKWTGKILNIHPSLLPKYKGLHTHQRALDAGDDQAGCSVHLVTAALDDGPIVGQAAVPIHKTDTADDIAARVLIQEHKLYPSALADYLANGR